jgi:dGTPase
MENPLPDDVYKKRKKSKEYPNRGEYFRDQTAIIHCMPFRRLKHKTQVFFSPENDHVCTRIEHVMHVASIAAGICKGLNIAESDARKLDAELAYTIGLGHDIGHAPFGHAGEESLDNKLASDSGKFIHETNGLRVVDFIANDGKGLNLTFAVRDGIVCRNSDRGEFIHETNGLRVVDCLANDGEGLNLTYAVRDGIVCHNGEKFEPSLKPLNDPRDPSEVIDRICTPTTYEGCIVRFSDKIAYLGRDIEDAIVAGFIEFSDVPYRIRNQLGSSHGEIINTLVLDLIENSKFQNEICFSDDKFKLITELKEFNTREIYNHPTITKYKEFWQKIVDELFDYLCNLYSALGKDYKAYEAKDRIGLDRYFGQYLKKMHAFYMKESYIPQRIGGCPEFCVNGIH